MGRGMFRRRRTHRTRERIEGTITILIPHITNRFGIYTHNIEHIDSAARIRATNAKNKHGRNRDSATFGIPQQESQICRKIKDTDAQDAGIATTIRKFN